MTNLYAKIIGIPWYRPERYDVARARMADADSLPVSYDLWLERAEQREQQIRSSGDTPARIYVDDDEFVAFCRERNIILDGVARSRFASASHVGILKTNVTNYDNPSFRHGGMRRRR